MKPIFSVIIIGKSINSYLIECLQKLANNNYQNFETLVVLDEKSKKIDFPSVKFLYLNKGPAEKRDFAVSITKGHYLAFIDDDAYPSRDWLKNALSFFDDQTTAAVCGPGVTPPQDNLFQKVGGWVNSVKIGQGPYTLRFIPEKRRYVDDFPSMNFIIRKSDFLKIGGFDTNFWPGEDTKLCLDIVKKLGKKIIYDPKVLVYHHRRPIFRKHLSQIGRYGLHRGYFAKILPATSLRISYFLPSFLVMVLIMGPFSFYLSQAIFTVHISIVSLYLSVVLLTSLSIFLQETNLFIALLFIPAIISTHLIYGLRFLQGFLFTKDLKR